MDDGAPCIAIGESELSLSSWQTTQYPNKIKYLTNVIARLIDNVERDNIPVQLHPLRT